jgi:general stress protein 26
MLHCPIYQVPFHIVYWQDIRRPVFTELLYKKEARMSDLKQKILAKIDKPTLSALATLTEDGKPWVRYVTPRADKDLNLWLATFIGSRKVSQVRKNPEVHVTTGVIEPEKAESYLQIQGRAEILTDAESRNTVWGDFLQPIFSGPDDPNLCVCKITPYLIEYHTLNPPGSPPEVLEGI